ncbi:MAG: cyanophycin synthetase, partial [Ottowia sp.]|nr:cyanophycin synthetase [Ottowia sp.]
AVRAHLAEGGRAVFERGTEIILGKGKERFTLLDLAAAPYATLAAAAAPGRTPAVLAAVATAWAMGIAPELIAAGLQSWGQQDAQAALQ